MPGQSRSMQPRSSGGGRPGWHLRQTDTPAGGRRILGTGERRRHSKTGLGASVRAALWQSNNSHLGTDRPTGRRPQRQKTLQPTV